MNISRTIACVIISAFLLSTGSGLCVAQTQLPTDQEIDLLAMVKLPDHAVQGTWKRIDGALSIEQFPAARVMIPVVAEGDYTVSMQFTRLKGQDCVALIVPIADTQVLIQVDGWRGKYAGISELVGYDLRQLVGSSAAVQQPSPLPNPKRHELSVSVSKKRTTYSIEASLNGTKFANWTGRAGELSFQGNWTLPNPKCFGVLVYHSIADIQSAKLVLGKKSEGHQLADDWRNPLSVVDNKPSSQVARLCVDWDGKKYLISAKPMHLADAQRLAARVNGRLLTISSTDEQQFIFEQGRGVSIGTSGWRPPHTRQWRDERNLPWKYSGQWLRGQPNARKGIQWNIGVKTGSKAHWNDLPASASLHACIEWGEEYPESQ